MIAIVPLGGVVSIPFMKDQRSWDYHSLALLSQVPKLSQCDCLVSYWISIGGLDPGGCTCYRHCQSFVQVLTVLGLSIDNSLSRYCLSVYGVAICRCPIWVFTSVQFGFGDLALSSPDWYCVCSFV